MACLRVLSRVAVNRDLVTLSTSTDHRHEHVMSCVCVGYARRTNKDEVRIKC